MESGGIEVIHGQQEISTTVKTLWNSWVTVGTRTGQRSTHTNAPAPHKLHTKLVQTHGRDKDPDLGLSKVRKARAKRNLCYERRLDRISRFSNSRETLAGRTKPQPPGIKSKVSPGYRGSQHIAGAFRRVEI